MSRDICNRNVNNLKRPTAGGWAVPVGGADCWDMCETRSSASHEPVPATGEADPRHQAPCGD